MPDEEKAKFMFWEEFPMMARNSDAHEGRWRPTTIAEVNNTTRPQDITLREVQLHGVDFGFKADEARKLFETLIAFMKEGCSV